MYRSWLRWITEVTKRYRIAAAAHNLGRLLWQLLGVGKPWGLQGRGGLLAAYEALLPLLFRLLAQRLPPDRRSRGGAPDARLIPALSG